MEEKESDILKAIMDYLAARRILAFRMNTGAFFGGGRAIRFGVKGMADILAFPSYQNVLWIEVKRKGGRLSSWQMGFAQVVTEYGHDYLVARSVEDVKGVLSE